MTIYAFNRRITVESTYHVRRRPNRRRVQVHYVSGGAMRAAMWCSGLTLTIGVAIARLAGVL